MDSQEWGIPGTGSGAQSLEARRCLPCQGRPGRSRRKESGIVCILREGDRPRLCVT